MKFTEDEQKLILTTCCSGATESEARALMAIAEARGMNPIVGDCYFVKRWDPATSSTRWSVQAGIDAFRSKAEATGDYAGQDAPTFTYDAKGFVESATVAVYRKSCPGRPFVTATAFFAEYVQTKKGGEPTQMWAKMPRNQLAKCAESLALRKAFPKELAKVYTSDEMAQSEPVALPVHPTNYAAFQTPPVTALPAPLKAEPMLLADTPGSLFFLSELGQADSMGDVNELIALIQERRSEFSDEEIGQLKTAVGEAKARLKNGNGVMAQVLASKPEEPVTSGFELAVMKALASCEDKATLDKIVQQITDSSQGEEALRLLPLVQATGARLGVSP